MLESFLSSHPLSTFFFRVSNCLIGTVNLYHGYFHFTVQGEMSSETQMNRLRRYTANCKMKRTCYSRGALTELSHLLGKKVPSYHAR